MIALTAVAADLKVQGDLKFAEDFRLSRNFTKACRLEVVEAMRELQVRPSDSNKTKTFFFERRQKRRVCPVTRTCKQKCKLLLKGVSVFVLTFSTGMGGGGGHQDERYLYTTAK